MNLQNFALGPGVLNQTENTDMEALMKMTQYTAITVTTEVQAPLDRVWSCWTMPDCVMQWNHASDDWHCPAASNDLRVGGRYVYTMAARDGSFSFDFAGTYTEIVQGERIISQLDDGRMINVSFETVSHDVTRVVETFDAEHENTFDLQRQGWQAILDNFKKEAEAFKPKA